MSQPSQLIVTHKSPDLDAIGAVWLLKRFDAQHFADAKVAFVASGDTISDQEMNELGFTADTTTHVDTGLGKFDHHRPEQGHLKICATSLVYSDHLCQIHPELENDSALKSLVDFVTEIDHFQEIYWPDAGSDRYAFTIHSLLHGLQTEHLHDDDSQLHFGMTCLDAAYGELKLKHKAEESIADHGQEFEVGQLGTCLAIESQNDGVLKVAQKKGTPLVVKRDPETGHIRVKARPDADIDLKALSEKVIKLDPDADWYYHPSGKMFLNSSSKSSQRASTLSLQQVVDLIKEIYD